MASTSSFINRIARIGLTAKGIVYLSIAAIALMAAFNWRGQQDDNADNSGAFRMIMDMGGAWILGIIALGLLCYICWRLFQAFSKRNNGWKRARYFFSALSYAAVAFTAVRLILFHRGGSGSQNQEVTARLLAMPAGQWLVYAGALIFFGVGLYQLYYGLSHRYRKHVQDLDLHTDVSGLLLRMGKVGYIARGLVWLLVGYLFARAAFYRSSEEAGGTGEAFAFFSEGSTGTIISAAMAAGIAAYGLFCFVRARYERFG